jgi:hypothetical protein
MQDLNLLALAGARLVVEATTTRVRLSGIRQSFDDERNRTFDFLRQAGALTI